MTEALSSNLDQWSSPCCIHNAMFKFIFFSYQHFNSGMDIEKRGHNTPICSVKKVKKGEDHKLDVTPAHFRLDGHSYPFDPEVYQKGKIKCILNVPDLINSVKCEMDEIKSHDVAAIGGCTAYAY